MVSFISVLVAFVPLKEHLYFPWKIQHSVFILLDMVLALTIVIHLHLLLPMSHHHLERFLPCNPTYCKTCPIHIPTHHSAVLIPTWHLITTLTDCISSNLVYQLQYKKCSDFYIGEIDQMLLKCINGHQSTCMTVNTDLLVVPIHAKSHQLPLQECLFVHFIHKLQPSIQNGIPTHSSIPTVFQH